MIILIKDPNERRQIYYLALNQDVDLYLRETDSKAFVIADYVWNHENHYPTLNYWNAMSYKFIAITPEEYIDDEKLQDLANDSWSSR